jgi:RNA polymerase sigma factor (TIGR02999 family)
MCPAPRGDRLPDDVTRVLREACEGDESRWDEVLATLYEKLREIARRELHAQRSDHTIEPTALAHEAWARLATRTDAVWKDRGHFLAVAAVAMRGILVDEARARQAQKRGGGLDRITLTYALERESRPPDPVDILDLHAALNDLALLSARQARIVELRFFGGLTVEEIARALEVSVTTVEGEWRLARAWLSRRIDASSLR